jgi:hypothetical protein
VSTHPCPDKHAAREQLGKRHPSGELVSLRVSFDSFGGVATCDRFTSHDSDPKKSAGESIVLPLGSDVVDPPHDSTRQDWDVTDGPGLRGRTEGTFVKSLDDVYQTHEGQHPDYQHTTWLVTAG